jgi:predicted DNA-binding protein (MmcQ/YjbR family)
LPESGWISFYLNKAEDIGAAIELLRQSYELALKQKGLDA